MAGFASSSTTNSSATLDKSEVSDIGRISFLYPLAVFSLEWILCQLFSKMAEGVLRCKSS